MVKLTGNQKYGFLVRNTVEAYLESFRQLPYRTELSKKEDLLAKDLTQCILERNQIVLSWQDIAKQDENAFDAILKRSHVYV